MNAPDKGGTNAPESNGEEFASAIGYEGKKSLGETFARKSLSINLILGLGQLFSFLAIGYLIWSLNHIDREYFATENGRITKVYPTNEPVLKTEEVIQFGADTILASFTMDFVNYKSQIAGVMPLYSDKGYQDYYQGLLKSNILDMVRQNRLNLTAAHNPGTVSKKGLLNGTYVWMIYYPVTLKLEGQKDSMPPKHFKILLTIARADTRLKPAGLEVIQTIMADN